MSINSYYLSVLMLSCMYVWVCNSGSKSSFYRGAAREEAREQCHCQIWLLIT
jgi:hypothetical protein